MEDISACGCQVFLQFEKDFGYRKFRKKAELGLRPINRRNQTNHQKKPLFLSQGLL
jgi:hypothetical protein